MSMNYERISKGLPKEEAAKYATGIGLVNDFVRSLKEKKLLPEEFSKPEASNALKTPKSALEIPTVSEALYDKTREFLVKAGFTLVVPIMPLSINQLSASDATRSRFDYINASNEMRSNVPEQMEIAIDLDNLRIKNSNRKSTDTQIEMIKEQEIALKGKLPEDIRDLISMIMPKHASVLAQLDFEHRKRTGRVLFTNWFGRTDDQTVPGSVAVVGRGGPASRLVVGGWGRGYGGDNVFAVPVVVLPRKLSV